MIQLYYCLFMYLDFGCGINVCRPLTIALLDWTRQNAQETNYTCTLSSPIKIQVGRLYSLIQTKDFWITKINFILCDRKSLDI